jgi:hypothetical protein
VGTLEIEGCLGCTVAAQQVAGADLAVENPFEAGLAFAALQVKFGHAAPAARRLSSGRWAHFSGREIMDKPVKELIENLGATDDRTRLSALQTILKLTPYFCAK